jgi:hypothetical protein
MKKRENSAVNSGWTSAGLISSRIERGSPLSDSLISIQSLVTSARMVTDNGALSEPILGALAPDPD